MEAPGWLRDAWRICVLTGAGISTDSGIPDYRGPQGVWTRDPEAEKLVTLSWYLRDPEIRRRSWLMRRELATADVRPNAGHLALAAAQGRLRALLTQNIDGLHQAAGSTGVLELHASRTPCPPPLAGSRRAPAGGRNAGEPDPACPVCGGVLKTATVYFGEALDADVVDAATRAAGDCDVFLAVGTSLGVHPAAGLVDVAAASSARVVVVNAEPTPYDGLADLVVRELIGTALPALLAAGR